MPTPIPGALAPNITLEFFEEAAANALAAGQHVALMPGDLAALCRMARAAGKLEPDVRSLASYGLQSAVPEVSEAARRVLSGRSSLPPAPSRPEALRAAAAKLPPLGLKPLDIKEDRTLAQRQADGDAPNSAACDECGGVMAHLGNCGRLQ
jgi:hypothetical protein